jgi:putative acetyltransferase
VRGRPLTARRSFLFSQPSNLVSRIAMTIRPESQDDEPGVRHVNERAFPTAAEADIVDALRANCPDVLSLVAEEQGRITGHILFSPATLATAGGELHGMALAPMAVLPERQNRGVGSALVRAGLDLLRQRGCPFVIVLGHPTYYPRFGFEPAHRFGIRPQWDGIPEEAFMISFLDAPGDRPVAGVARYRDEFDAAI